MRTRKAKLFSFFEFKRAKKNKIVSLSLSIEKVCRCKFEKSLTLIKIFPLMKNAFHASPTMTNVYIHIYIYLFSIAEHSVSFNSLTLFHVGTFHLFTPIKGRKPVGISPRSKERGEREKRGHIVNFNPISPAPTIPRIPSSLKWSFFSNSASRFDARFNQFSSSVHSAREYRDKKWKIFRVIPYVPLFLYIDPFDSSNSFLQNPSIYRDRSSLVSFLCIDSFHFPTSFFQSIYFNFSLFSLNSLLQTLIYCDFSSFVFFRIDSFHFPSPFLQTIQTIYRDFSSFFKFPFTNLYLSRFLFVFFPFIDSFLPSSNFFFAKYPKHLLRFFLPFSFLSYRFSASLFLARFHLRGHPTSASKSSISIVVPPQKRFSPPPDSSLRDSLARRPPWSPRFTQDTAEILLHSVQT